MKNVRGVLVMLLVVISARESAAQIKWEKVFTFSGRIAELYFYDAELGFACVGIPAYGSLSPAIYRTLDAGRTWDRCVTPTALGCGVNDVHMVDRMNGWAAADAPNGGLWRTTDGGATWVVATGAANPISVGNSVRVSNRGVLVSDFLNGKVVITSDGGKSFQPSFVPYWGDYILGMDFLDSVHGVVASTFRGGNMWAYTSDGGLTWNPSNYRMESWTVHGMKGTSLFFAAPEGYSNTANYLTELMRSDDYGKTWKLVRTLPFRTTSDIEPCGKALYVQTGYIECTDCIFPDGIGVYRSLDSGLTWTGLGGPDDWGDTRFAVTTGCKSNIILCCDRNNVLYRGEDSAVVDLTTWHARDHSHIYPPRAMELNHCGDSSSMAIVAADACYPLVLTSVGLEGSDSAFFRLVRAPLPVTISATEDTTFVFVNEDPDSGSYHARIHLRGYFDLGNGRSQPFDTVVFADALVAPAPPILSADPAQLVFAGATRCSIPHDTTIVLRNAGCDSLTIVAGPGALAPAFAFDSLELPRSLAPGETLAVRVHFDASTGDANSIARFQTISNGRAGGLVVPIEGIGPAAGADILASATAMSLRLDGICDTASAMLRLTNQGCDTARLISAPGSLAGGFFFDSLALPIIIAPGASIELRVRFHPSTVGSAHAVATYRFEDGSSVSTSLIGVASMVAPQFEIDPPTLALGVRSVCEVPLDTTITLRNRGCDSLFIVSGPGSLPPEFWTDSLQLPIAIAPGASATVGVHFHPSADGAFVAQPVFVAERFGATNMRSMNITATGMTGKGILQSLKKSFEFAPMTICATGDSLGGLATNPGCDTLTVLSVHLSESPGMSCRTPKLPLQLPPGDTMRYEIFFTPVLKGANKGSVTIDAYSAHDASTRYSDELPIAAFVGDGVRLLSISPNSVDLGSSRLCVARDSFVTLRNDGCDTLTIASAAVIGGGFSLRDTAFPIVLPPASSQTIGFVTTLDTAGRNLRSSAALVIKTNAESGAESITVAHGYEYPAQYTISIPDTALHGAPGDTVRFDIRTDRELEHVRTIDLDLGHNSDLLEFVRASGPNQVSVAGDHVRIDGEPEIVSNGGVVATLSYAVFLTTVSSGELTVSNVHLNSDDPDYESCVAFAVPEARATTFVAAYDCGEPTLAGFLSQKMPVRIRSIYPDPATYRLTLDLESAHAADLELLVRDQLGRTVVRKVVTARSGDVRTTLEIAGLTAGTYSVDVTDGNWHARSRFMKVR